MKKKIIIGLFLAVTLLLAMYAYLQRIEAARQMQQVKQAVQEAERKRKIAEEMAAQEKLKHDSTHAPAI
ncbi:MAG TPA: hypothetical protein VGK59_22865 [Ohtaekwangia sp.]